MICLFMTIFANIFQTAILHHLNLDCFSRRHNIEEQHTSYTRLGAFLRNASALVTLYFAWTGVNERTFVAVKPDGVQRRLVGLILNRFEQKGFKLVGLKLMQASEGLLKDHYIELREKPFYEHLIRYMSSGPVVAMVWQGFNVVKMARKMLGETNPADSLPGTIRGDFCVDVSRNVVHGSDSIQSARREILLWFRQDELICWDESAEPWIYE